MIDCEPFGPRPDQYLPNALEYTGLKCKPAVRKLFGEWTFDVNAATLNELLPVLIANLTRSHNEGAIRYAEWTPHIK
tara:strand:+ start:658 stop:888 length:231 start_codon:yes stop_codon:yes gene_type:complete